MGCIRQARPCCYLHGLWIIIMIVYNNLDSEKKEIESIYWKGKEIVAQYAADNKGRFHLIWEKATSCFGRGYWANQLPWKNDVPWKNTA